MTGRVIQRVDQIVTKDQCDRWLVFYNGVGNKIGYIADGFPLPVLSQEWMIMTITLSKLMLMKTLMTG